MSDSIIFDMDYRAFDDITEKRVYDVRMQARDYVGNEIRTIIYERVRYYGQGADGNKLRGYSTEPFTFQHGSTDHLKPMRTPGGVTPGPKGGYYFPGGYQAYVASIGQDPNLFNLENMGALWRDFRYLKVSHVDEPIMIGFTDARNFQVADGQMNKRPGILDLSDMELDRVRDGLIEFLSNTWTGGERWRQRTRTRTK